MLCSTAVRTRQTLAGLELPDEPVVLYERGLYGASEIALLERLRMVRDDVTAVMLVAHNPGAEELADALAGSGALLAKLREKFPTGALASLSFDGGWQSLDRGVAELEDFVVPRELPDG